jgi:hypothetical protein
LTGTLYEVEFTDSDLKYSEQHLGGPLSLGHFLISYPLELHGDVWEVVSAISDPRIKVRHSAGTEHADQAG